MLFRVPTGVFWNSWLLAFSKALSLGFWCQGQGNISTSETDAGWSTELRPSGREKLKLLLLSQAFAWQSATAQGGSFQPPGPQPKFSCFTISKSFLHGAAWVKCHTPAEALEMRQRWFHCLAAPRREPKTTRADSRWVCVSCLLQTLNSQIEDGEQVCFLLIFNIWFGFVEGKRNHPHFIFRDCDALFLPLFWNGTFLIQRLRFSV